MSTLTDEFIELIYEISGLPFPDEVISQTKKCIIDYLGVVHAGSFLLNEKANIYLDNVPKGQVPIIGLGRKAGIYDGALVNALNSHAAELDDGERRGSVHPGAPVISALLSIAVQHGLNGRDFLKGIIVGYEAAIRLARAIQPTHRNKGFHATGVCGGIGAAMGIGAALSFSKRQLKATLSATATSCGGLLNVIQGTSELKPYNAAQAAVSGIIAANTAFAGFDGTEDVLAGKWGFLCAYSDGFDDSELISRTGDKYAIENVYMKPYAACRHCHPAIEAALAIMEREDIEPHQIIRINVHTYRLAKVGHDHTDIHGTTSAKMSVPFSVAAAIINGKAGINEFTKEQVARADILDLAKKVFVTVDDELNALVPVKRPAVMEMLTDKGSYRHRVDLAKGEPEAPMTNAEIFEKFRLLLEYAGKDTEYTHNLVSLVEAIETKLEELLRVL